MYKHKASRLNGIIHREGGTKEWWINGQLHREDGPAIEYPDGSREWWINNKCFEKFNLYDIFEYMISYQHRYNYKCLL